MLFHQFHSRLKDNPADEADPEADADTNDKKKKKNKTNAAVMRVPFDALPWTAGICAEAQGFVKELLVKRARCLCSRAGPSSVTAGQGPRNASGKGRMGGDYES